MEADPDLWQLVTSYLHLTQREKQVLWLIVNSYNTKGMAAVLRLSPKTVEYHRAQIYHKLRLRDTAALTRFAIKIDLIPL